MRGDGKTGSINFFNFHTLTAHDGNRTQIHAEVKFMEDSSALVEFRSIPGDESMQAGGSFG